MRKALIILMVSLMLPAPCFADMVTAKAKTCWAWTQHRKIGDAPAMVDEAWLAGYLAGISASADVDFIRTIDADSVREWMDSYCQAHPLKFLEDAGQALALELGERKHPRKH